MMITISLLKGYTIMTHTIIESISKCVYTIQYKNCSCRFLFDLVKERCTQIILGDITITSFSTSVYLLTLKSKTFIFLCQEHEK